MFHRKRIRRHPLRLHAAFQPPSETGFTIGAFSGRFNSRCPFITTCRTPNYSYRFGNCVQRCNSSDAPPYNKCDCFGSSPQSGFPLGGCELLPGFAGSVGTWWSSLPTLFPSSGHSGSFTQRLQLNLTNRQHDSGRSQHPSSASYGYGPLKTHTCSPTHLHPGAVSAFISVCGPAPGHTYSYPSPQIYSSLLYLNNVLGG